MITEKDDRKRSIDFFGSPDAPLYLAFVEVTYADNFCQDFC